MTDEPGRTCVAAWLHFLSIGCIETQRKLIYFKVHPCLCQRREMGPYSTIEGSWASSLNTRTHQNYNLYQMVCASVHFHGTFGPGTYYDGRSCPICTRCFHRCSSRIRTILPIVENHTPHPRSRRGCSDSTRPPAQKLAVGSQFMKGWCRQAPSSHVEHTQCREYRWQSEEQWQ